MARFDDLRLMTKVARMYYEYGVNQPEIAQRLDLSQATISRLLKRAQRENIVRITISVPRNCYPELEEALERRYGLKEAIVAECVSSDEEQVLRDIGAAAANYLETTIKPNEVIGISSWSESLLAMVDAMHPVSTRSSARVVQILGGVGTPAAEVHATRLTERLASLVGGEELMLPAPGVVGSTASRQVFLEDPFVSEVMAKFKSISLALVGIGAISPAQLIEASGNTFSPEELIVLEESGAVGDICLRFFDATGAPVITSLDERVIGITLEELRRVRRCVGIAGGPRKLAAIESALQGRLVNVLITDRFTAEALI